MVLTLSTAVALGVLVLVARTSTVVAPDAVATWVSEEGEDASVLVAPVVRGVLV